MKSVQDYMSKLTKDKNTLLPAIAIAAIVIVGGLAYANTHGGLSLPGLGMSNQAVADNAVAYINNNQLSQSQATLVEGSVTSEYGLVKFKISIGGQSFDSYATRDGKFLFPQALDISGSSAVAGSGASQPATKVAAADIEKSDNPMLEAFVVSRCPYGLQLQRALSDAITNAPDLAKYVTVRYIGSVGGVNGITAMHGDAEALENLRQICIREEQPTKYWPYTDCQMKAGDTAGCEKSTGVDSTKLNACISDQSRGVAYAQEDFALQNQFGANASPTLVMGKGQVSEFDFGGRSADALKQLVCAGFNNQPGFCSQSLNTAQAATSFSQTYAAAAGAAPAAAADCAPVQ